MNMWRTKTMAVATAFLLGFAMGGLSLHYAQAQGMLGLSASVKQIGTTLADMKKNVDALQQNMSTLTQVKEQLNALASPTDNPLLKEGESIKQGGESLQKLFGQ